MFGRQFYQPSVFLDSICKKLISLGSQAESKGGWEFDFFHLTLQSTFKLPSTDLEVPKIQALVILLALSLQL